MIRQLIASHPADLTALIARRRVAIDRPGGQDDGELLPGLTVPGVQDHVLGVGIYADDPSYLARDPRFFPGLADRSLGEGFAEVDGTTWDGPVAVVRPLDEQDIPALVGHHDIHGRDEAVGLGCAGVVVVVVDPA